VRAGCHGAVEQLRAEDLRHLFGGGAAPVTHTADCVTTPVGGGMRVSDTSRPDASTRGMRGALA
jgi:hypothetical protein